MLYKDGELVSVEEILLNPDLFFRIKSSFLPLREVRVDFRSFVQVQKIERKNAQPFFSVSWRSPLSSPLLASVPKLLLVEFTLTKICHAATSMICSHQASSRTWRPSAKQSTTKRRTRPRPDATSSARTARRMFGRPGPSRLDSLDLHFLGLRTHSTIQNFYSVRVFL